MNNLAAYGFEMVFTGRGSYYGEIRTTEFGGAPLKRKPNPWMMLPKKRSLTAHKSRTPRMYMLMYARNRLPGAFSGLHP